MRQIVPFLLGVVAIASITASVFFLKFWRSTRDILFAAFAAFFLLEGAERVVLLFSERPNEGTPWIHTIRLAALMLILVAILGKNYGSSGA